MSKFSFFLCVGILVLPACGGKGVRTDSAPEASAQDSPSALQPISGKDSVDLNLRGTVGETSLTFYHSDSAVEDYEDSQKVRDHQEVMDFMVSAEVTDVKSDRFTARTKTIQKDGTGALHDFAFPETDETIDFIYTGKGTVLAAEPFPKESIFYLPPISLPKSPVRVGDTWTMDHTWVSSNDGIPLNLNMVTILKQMVTCGHYGRCADLEVSGRVDVVSAHFHDSVVFDSRIWGRILFSLDKGDVIWSEVRSNENFRSSTTEMRVLSCMVSRMQLPGKPQKETCHPSTKAVSIPDLRF